MNYVPKCISKVLKFYWAWKLVFPRVKDWRSLEKQLVTQWCKVVWFKLDICDFFFFFAVKYYFLYFRTLVENLIIPFQLHLTVNRTTLSKAWGLWFSYTHDGCFVRHTVMCLATAATYFSRTLKKKTKKKKHFLGGDGHFMMKQGNDWDLGVTLNCSKLLHHHPHLWPCSVEWIFRIWYSVYLDNRMKWISVLGISIGSHRKPIHCLECGWMDSILCAAGPDVRKSPLCYRTC